MRGGALERGTHTLFSQREVSSSRIVWKERGGENKKKNQEASVRLLGVGEIVLWKTKTIRNLVHKTSQ